jgi:hypothetical protein
MPGNTAPGARHSDPASCEGPFGRGAEALINQLAAILLERAFRPQGERKLEQFLAFPMDEQDEVGLSLRIILLVADARAQCAELDRRILRR